MRLELHIQLILTAPENRDYMPAVRAHVFRNVSRLVASGERAHLHFYAHCRRNAASQTRRCSSHLQPLSAGVGARRVWVRRGVLLRARQDREVLPVIRALGVRVVASAEHRAALRRRRLVVPIVRRSGGAGRQRPGVMAVRSGRGAPSRRRLVVEAEGGPRRARAAAFTGGSQGVAGVVRDGLLLGVVRSLQAVPVPTQRRGVF